MNSLSQSNYNIRCRLYGGGGDLRSLPFLGGWGVGGVFPFYGSFAMKISQTDLCLELEKVIIMFTFGNSKP